MTDINPNSALHWLDATTAAADTTPVNTSATELIEFDFMDSLIILDGMTTDAIP